MEGITSTDFLTLRELIYTNVPPEELSALPAFRALAHDIQAIMAFGFFQFTDANPVVTPG